MKKVSEIFSRVKKWTESHKTLFALIITLLFVASQIPFLINHEIWNDEATSWQLSQEITPGNFYEINSAEPHPMLWQLVLAPFSKLGFPIITLNIISLVFVAAAVFLIFRFAPMGVFTKIVFLLSAAFFYFLPIISRDYSMIPLALTTVCLAYKNRHEKPFLYGLSLAFLSQTHFLMYGLVAILSVGWFIERLTENHKKVLKPLFLFALPLLVSVATSIPLIISSMDNQAILTGKTFENIPEEYRDPFFPNVVMSFFGDYNTGLEIFFIVLLVFVAISFFIKNQKTFIYLLGGVGFWFIVMGCVYKNYEVFSPKVALIPLMVFAIIWLNHLETTKKENKIEKLVMHSELIKILYKKVTRDWYVVFAIIFALSTIFNTYTFAIDDLNRPFSNAKEIAGYINEKIEPGSIIIEGEPGAILGSAVYAYIENDVTIYNLMLGRVEEKIDNLKYNNETIERNRKKFAEGTTEEEMAALFMALTPKYEHVYYLGVPPSCNSNNSPVIRQTIEDNFERLEIFNNEEYLDTSHTIFAIYKIQ